MEKTHDEQPKKKGRPRKKVDEPTEKTKRLQEAMANYQALQGQTILLTKKS